MNRNVLGGTLSVAALAAIFTYGQTPTQAPVPVPAPQAQVPVAPPAPPAPPAPAPVVKPVQSTTTVYHRVEQGGAQGPVVSCVTVKPFADGKSPADIAAAAKQYGVTPDDVRRYYVCLQ